MELIDVMERPSQEELANVVEQYFEPREVGAVPKETINTLSKRNRVLVTVMLGELMYSEHDEREGLKAVQIADALQIDDGNYFEWNFYPYLRELEQDSLIYFTDKEYVVHPKNKEDAFLSVPEPSDKELE